MRGREGKKARGRRRGAGLVREAAGHRALRARPLFVPRAPGAGPLSPPACRGSLFPGSCRACPARAPAARETRPPRGLAPFSPRPLPSPFGPRSLRPLPRGSSVLFFRPPCQTQAAGPGHPFPAPVAPRVLGAHPWGVTSCLWGAALLRSLEGPRFSPHIR